MVIESGQDYELERFVGSNLQVGTFFVEAKLPPLLPLFDQGI